MLKSNFESEAAMTTLLLLHHSTPEVSELTGYSAQSIQRWCNQKILVSFKIRGTLTIPRLATAMKAF